MYAFPSGTERSGLCKPEMGGEGERAFSMAIASLNHKMLNTERFSYLVGKDGLALRKILQSSRLERAVIFSQPKANAGQPDFGKEDDM